MFCTQIADDNGLSVEWNTMRSETLTGRPFSPYREGFVELAAIRSITLFRKSVFHRFSAGFRSRGFCHPRKPNYVPPTPFDTAMSDRHREGLCLARVQCNMAARSPMRRSISRSSVATTDGLSPYIGRYGSLPNCPSP